MSAPGQTSKEILLDDVARTAGSHVLDTLEPKKVATPATTPFTSTKNFIPSCRTQAPVPRPLRKGPAHIMVGLGSECPRWTPGSVIKWAAWREGFESQEDADYAAEHLSIAAQKWNEANIGVTFEWVALAQDATFVLTHGGNEDGVLASAFFPNSDDLSIMYVYTDAFKDSDWKENMWKIFTHELGHVIGLRHEFAMSSDPNWFEGGAVQLGPRDELSVMNYRPEPPELQESDITSTKTFYELKPDENGKPPRVGRTKVKDYTPM
ncbi:hypothetical protein ABW19_dt0205518 [Dactylella cylindrospora]|nr:hypothetical protein ABW19_dt0205518 [Dactylella cylindrospora]